MYITFGGGTPAFHSHVNCKKPLGSGDPGTGRRDSHLLEATSVSLAVTEVAQLFPQPLVTVAECWGGCCLRYELTEERQLPGCNHICMQGPPESELRHHRQVVRAFYRPTIQNSQSTCCMTCTPQQFSTHDVLDCMDPLSAAIPCNVGRRSPSFTTLFLDVGKTANIAQLVVNFFTSVSSSSASLSNRQAAGL